MNELRIVLPASAIEAMSGDYKKGERGVHVSPPILHGLRLANFVSSYFYNNYESSSYAPGSYFYLGEFLEDLEAYELLTRGGFQAFEEALDEQVMEIVSKVRAEEERLQVKAPPEEVANFDEILRRLLESYKEGRKASTPIALKLQRHFMASVGGVYHKPQFSFLSTKEEKFPYEVFHRLAVLRDELFEEWDQSKFILYLEILAELRATELYQDLMDGMSKYLPHFLPPEEIKALEEDLEVESLWFDLTKSEGLP